MRDSTTKNKQHRLLLWTGSLAFWLSVWYLIALAIGNEIFLPYPHTVIRAWFSLLVTGVFWRSVLGSLFSVMGGLALGIVIGVLLSLLAVSSEWIRAIVHPLVVVLRATPVASFIILVYVMVRLSHLPVATVSLIIVAIMVIPLIYQNLSEGYASLDKSLEEVAKIYRFTLKKKISVLWIPQLRPYASAALSTALGLSWKVGVSAEVICSLRNTVGQHLADAKSNLEIDRLFAWTFTVILLSMLLESAFRLFTRNTNTKEKKTEGMAV